MYTPPTHTHNHKISTNHPAWVESDSRIHQEGGRDGRTNFVISRRLWKKYKEMASCYLIITMITILLKYVSFSESRSNQLYALNSISTERLLWHCLRVTMTPVICNSTSQTSMFLQIAFGIPLKMQILIQYIYNRAWESTFLTNHQMMPMLLRTASKKQYNHLS